MSGFILQLLCVTYYWWGRKAHLRENRSVISLSFPALISQAPALWHETASTKWDISSSQGRMTLYMGAQLAAQCMKSCQTHGDKRHIQVILKDTAIQARAAEEYISQSLLQHAVSSVVKREGRWDAFFFHSEARCRLKCQTCSRSSYSGNGKAEYGALGLCTFSRTQRNLSYLFVSWPTLQQDWGRLPSTSLHSQSFLLRRAAPALNLHRLRLFSIPQTRVQLKTVYLLTSLPLCMRLTGSGQGCRVLQGVYLC